MLRLMILLYYLKGVESSIKKIWELENHFELHSLAYSSLFHSYSQLDCLILLAI
jgi:hypothetical protein